jgi:hypothetical protein
MCLIDTYEVDEVGLEVTWMGFRRRCYSWAFEVTSQNRGDTPTIPTPDFGEAKTSSVR